ncbi:MAG: hypothetical protein IKS32_00160 [Solobacterium sp.]|nr:hypothetical protein [Solobacterium sp.]
MNENDVIENIVCLSNRDRSLLLKVADQQKTSIRFMGILLAVETLFLIVMIGALAYFSPKLVVLLENMNSAVNQITFLAEKAVPAVEGVAKLDYEQLNDSILQLQESVKKMNEFMSGLSSLGTMFH